MTGLDPTLATPRTDLPYLRTRSRPRAAPPASPELSLSLPTPGTASSSLDLSTAPTPQVRRSPSTSRRRPERRRAESGAQTLLSLRAPTVTLTRLQSGVGKLTVEAACSAGVGDLRLGCAYQLRGGLTSTVQHSGGNRQGPADGKRPVLQGERHDYEAVTVDLRRCSEVERLMFYAFSESHAPLTWGGTLVVTTYGDATIEVPLELGKGTPVGALLSIYNVAGEFVLRREMEPFESSVKAACVAYGYDRITWLDDWTPIN